MATSENYAELGWKKRLQSRIENGRRIRVEEPSYEEALEEIRNLGEYEVEWLYMNAGTRGEGPATEVSDNMEQKLSRADDVDVFAEVREEGTLLSFASVDTRDVLSGELEREEGRKRVYVGVEDKELF